MALTSLLARLARPVRRCAALVLLLVLAALAAAGPAAADGVSQYADVSIAASFGGNELTVVLRQEQSVPGPLQVDVIAHDPVHAAVLTLSVLASQGLPGADTQGQATVRLVPGRPGTYPASLFVDRTGPWELDVADGQDTMRLPFQVLMPRAAPWERIAYPALLVAGLLLLGVFAAAVCGRRRLAVPLAALVAVALTVASTTALLSGDFTATNAAGSPTEKLLVNADGTTANGRAFADQLLSTVPAAPQAGSAFALDLQLSDGASGAPINDLVVHHGALAHTVITSQDFTYFAHLHPVPVQPGDLLLRLTLPRPGHYLVQTEITRVDSGSQLLTTTLDVGGTAPSTSAQPAAPQPGLDTAQDSQVTLSPSRPVAGRPAEITLHAGTAAAPESDLQGWLGMSGHLFVRAPGSDFFGHVHETASMAALAVPGAVIPDETVGQYGPLLHFVFSFPAPGRYPVWIQYERGFRIHTVALTVDVTGDTP
ncbi:hypothetical protein P3T36_005713 [Kitasatospora sp. MAP12-15]|uniref:hypothetical protein n=1 Tax=unclassified Kitasatospora TaxID=2633591 RepID=UPI0024752BB7|nr:hypothetical protein [Kitasatospora sp. MAP12-44]MDH6113775.1 hypothetical protein [Kitasatospora sp. MAP12-44]